MYEPDAQEMNKVISYHYKKVETWFHFLVWIEVEEKFCQNHDAVFFEDLIMLQQQYTNKK